MLTFLTLLACLPEFPNRTTEYLENPDADYDQDGYTENQGDCNDNDPTTFPDADELCDGADNDCNGLLDDDPVDAKPFYLDADNDGVGQVNFTVTECEAPNGYIDLVFDEDGEILDDCDDDDRFVNPLAVEFCDGKDNDCDRDIDDADDDLQGNAFWYRDSDGDTFPSNEERREECSQPNGFVQGEETLPTALIDCNDSDASINPGANEVCDQVDNDCDGLVDDADTEEVMDHLWTVDADGDGFGSATAGADTQASCEPITGYARLATDCDDNNFAIHPDAEEVCDYIDQNCNGQVDEGQGVKIPWYLDEDGDGFGANPSVMSPIEDCPQANPAGYVLNADDCDDGNGSTHPDADEYCDGVDNNCDLLVDDNGSVDATAWFLDGDGDGYGSNGNQFVSCAAPTGYVADNTDCDDGRANVHPDTEENCATIYDDNCDGVENNQDAIGCSTFYKDADGDAFGHQTDSACFRDPELTLHYTVQNNSDCDDNANAVNPDQIEVCDAGNLVDENCNGDTNDIGASGCSNFFYDYDGDAFGTDDFLCMCSPDLEYTAVVGDDCNDLEGAVNPAAQEVCDDFDVDEDCSGVADDASAPGSVLWYRDGDGDGYGTATTTIDQCDQPTGYLLQDGDCDDANPALNPGEIEICVLDPLTNQHRDEDCSGSDNDPNINDYNGGTTYYADVDGDGYGVAGDTVYACYAEGDYTAVTDGDCDDTLNSVNPSQAEVCATSDDEDCDGQIDENGALDCTVYYKDVDNDGYGLGNDSVCSCVEQGDYRASIGADCDDGDALVNSGLGNCGLMGNVPASDAAYVIDQGYTDLTNNKGTFDYNNDGHIDMIAVDPYSAVINGVQYNGTGGIFIFLGPFDGDLAKENADVVIVSNLAGDGLSLKYAGNLDGDPHQELMVRGTYSGWHLVQNGLEGQGQVTIDHVLMDDIDTTGLASRYLIELVGDLNNDGLVDGVEQGDSDVCFGEDDNGDGVVDEFSSRVDMGSNQSQVVIDLDNDSVNEIFRSTQANYQFGYLDSSNAFLVTHTIEDVDGLMNSSRYDGGALFADNNGDGLQDLYIRASESQHYYDSVLGNLSNVGLICVLEAQTAPYQFPSDLVHATWCVRGDRSSDLGSAFETLDINGDGYTDLLANHRMGGYKRTVLYYGPLSSPLDSNGQPRIATLADGDANFSILAVDIRSLGDLNNDGYDDFAVVDYQRSWYIYYGVPN